MKCVTLRILGKVQGVFFRNEARKKAEALGIKGFAHNEPDGSVLIEAEGEDRAVDQFISWCGEGPSSARVEKLEKQEGPLRGFKEFQIL